jgi:hypothetical protein
MIAATIIAGASIVRDPSRVESALTRRARQGGLRVLGDISTRISMRFDICAGQGLARVSPRAVLVKVEYKETARGGLAVNVIEC